MLWRNLDDLRLNILFKSLSFCCDIPMLGHISPSYPGLVLCKNIN